MVAYDSEDPQRRVTADVTVFITRNPSGPAFLQDPYERIIGENFPLGDTVINTTAVDLDGVSDARFPPAVALVLSTVIAGSCRAF